MGGRQPVSHKFMAESSAEIYMDMLIEYNGEDCHIHRQIITRLVIKEIVTTIGDNAFEDYEVLKELKLCDGLRQIGNYYYAIIEAVEPFKLHPTSMSYIYKVFEHL
jgi:hypothetical protein